MSFIKEAQGGGNGRGDLHFGRTHIDGLPFRGKPGMLKDHEYEDLTEVVSDAYVDLFEVTEPAEREKMQEVMDRVANRTAFILRYADHFHTKADGSPGLLVYLVWYVAQREVAPYRSRNMVGGIS